MKGFLNKILPLFFIGWFSRNSRAVKPGPIIPEPGIENKGHGTRIRKKQTPGTGKKRVAIAGCKKLYRNWHVSKYYHAA